MRFKTTTRRPTFEKGGGGGGGLLGGGDVKRKTIKAKATKEEGGLGTPNINPNQMLIYVPPHPLLKHWLAVARNAASPSALFRSAMAEIGKILMYELSRDWLETYEAQVQGPLAVANVEVVDPSKAISIVPVLRAGLTLVDKAHEVLPTTKTYHLGYARDETTLEATKYLDKLPKNGFSKEDKVLISDPMLATGGTIVRVVQDVLDKGADVKNVRVMCCVAAPPALTKLSESFPGLVVYAAIIDENVTEEGFIIPGLGDAGDRAFGTD
jgi:uracil phosphoribosyltransferase